jgi:hypothetical protein
VEPAGTTESTSSAEASRATKAPSAAEATAPAMESATTATMHANRRDFASEGGSYHKHDRKSPVRTHRKAPAKLGAMYWFCSYYFFEAGTRVSVTAAELG